MRRGVRLLGSFTATVTAPASSASAALRACMHRGIGEVYSGAGLVSWHPDHTLRATDMIGHGQAEHLHAGNDPFAAEVREPELHITSADGP